MQQYLPEHFIADGVDHTAPGTAQDNNVAASATGFANERALPSMPAFPTQEEVIAKHPHLAPKSAEQIKTEISAEMSVQNNETNERVSIDASGAQAEDELIEDEYTMQQVQHPGKMNTKEYTLNEAATVIATKVDASGSYAESRL